MKLKNLPLSLRRPRQVQAVDRNVRFECFTQDPTTDELQKVQYRIDVDGVIPIVIFQVERPSIPEVKIEAACSYVIRFLNEAITNALMDLVFEACHITHGTGPKTKQEVARLVSQHAKKTSERRLRSRVSESAERRKLTYEIRGKYQERLRLLQAYETAYKKKFAEYKRQARKRIDPHLAESEFWDHVWREYRRQTYADLPPAFFTYADKVCRRELLAKDAALEWLNSEYKLTPSTLDRTYLRPRKKIFPGDASVYTFEPEHLIQL